MSKKINDSGHINNAANFETMISRCLGFGERYKPSNHNLLIPFLQEYKAGADKVINDVTAKEVILKNATKERKAVAVKVKPLATRIINALKSSGISAETTKSAASVNRKLQGKRANPISKQAKNPGATAAEENPSAPKKVSTSQQGIDRVAGNFSQLIQVLKAEPTYTPNEADLTILSLEAFLSDLKAKNLAVTNAETDLNNARIARNKLMYNHENNIVSLAQSVKSYVKSVFGARSPEYKSVSSIKITSLV